ncbi:MAG: hypothetical protein HY686_07880 [Chloroflexi bacterium]|nr:hypothetical protein [Chloroflexota bacterium]
MPVRSWMPRGLAALLLALLAGAVAVSCASQGEPPPEQGTAPQSLTRVDEGQGGVTVQATWVTTASLDELKAGPLNDYPADSFVLILLSLDTHSGDLMSYDLPRLASLGGRSGSLIEASAWVRLADDSHHREGVLVFPGKGSEQWQAQEGKAELTLQGIAGVAQRSFRWEW